MKVLKENWKWLPASTSAINLSSFKAESSILRWKASVHQVQKLTNVPAKNFTKGDFIVSWENPKTNARKITKAFLPKSNKIKLLKNFNYKLTVFITFLSSRKARKLLSYLKPGHLFNIDQINLREMWKKDFVLISSVDCLNPFKNL